MLGRIALLLRTLLSHYWLHKAQTVFLLLGLSLGVAVMLSVLIINSSAKQAFQAGQHLLAGQVTGHISAPAHFIRDQDYIDLRKAGHSNISPMLAGRVNDIKQRSISLKGVELFATFHQMSAGGSAGHSQAPGFDVSAFSFPPYLSLISKNYAQRLGLEAGDVIELANGKRIDNIQIVPSSVLTGYQLLCDLKYAQQLLGQAGGLSAIVVTESDPKEIARLKLDLPKRFVYEQAQRSVNSTTFAHAFYLNLTSIAFIAFLIACFIAFNAARFSVLQRIPLVIQLRLCGASVAEIGLALMAELFLLALLSALLGCTLGWFLAKILVPGVGLTLVELFNSDRDVTLSWSMNWWWLAVTISLGACVVAIAPPFRKLLLARPLQKINHPGSNYSLFKIALALLLCGWGLNYLPASQGVGFAIAACWLLGGAFLLPDLLAIGYRLLLSFSPVKNSVKLHWLFSDAIANRHKTSTSLMACVLSVATLVALTTMVGSFKDAFADYLDHSLAEDLYISASAKTDLKQLDRYLQSHDQVKLRSKYFSAPVQIHTGKSEPQIEARLGTISSHALAQQKYHFERRSGSLWPRFNQQKGVVINQTLAFQLQLELGDQVEFSLGDSVFSYPVLGVFYNYGNTTAQLMINEAWYLSQFDNPDRYGIGIFMVDTSQLADFLEQLKMKFDLAEGSFYLAGEIKRMANTVFSRTFYITSQLSVLIMLIAAVGMYCASYINELEQFREKALLKILGINNRDLSLLPAVVICFNLLLVLLLAVPLGLLIAYVSIYTVMYYSLGWYFELVFYPEKYLVIAMITFVVMLLSWVLPHLILRSKTEMELLRQIP